MKITAERIAELRELQYWPETIGWRPGELRALLDAYEKLARAVEGEYSGGHDMIEITDQRPVVFAEGQRVLVIPRPGVEASKP